MSFKFISPLGKVEIGVGEGVAREAFMGFRFSCAGSKILVMRNDYVKANYHLSRI